MIIENDSIELRNVVSRKYVLEDSQFPKAMYDFEQLLNDRKLTPTGTLFFSLDTFPSEGHFAVEIYATVEEDFVSQNTDLFFRSYFTVSNMMMTYYTGPVERLTKSAYAEIIQFIEDNDWALASPFFQFFKGDRDFQYIELKVGVD